MRYEESKVNYKHIFDLKGKELLQYIGPDFDPHGFVLLNKQKEFIAEVFYENETHALFTHIGDTLFIKTCERIAHNEYYTHIDFIIDIIKCYSKYWNVFERKLSNNNILHTDITDRCLYVLEFLRKNKCTKEHTLYQIIEESNDFTWFDIYGKSGRFWNHFNILSFWYPDTIVSKENIDTIINIININRKDLILSFYDEYLADTYIKMYDELSNSPMHNKLDFHPAMTHNVAAKKRLINGFGSTCQKQSGARYWQTIQTSD